MELSQRLTSICNMISSGGTAADVGCDHGFVSIKLMEDKKFEKIIAMDVNEKPLAGALENIRAAGLKEKIELRLSDGLDRLWDKEADCVIIAGMGGLLINRILSSDINKLKNIKQLVLGAQSDLAKVRAFLFESGMAIVQEDMVEEEGKYYQLIKASYFEDIQAFYQDKYGLYKHELFNNFGPCLLNEKHPVMKKFLLDKEAKTLAVISEIQNRAAKEESEEKNQRMALRLSELKVFYQLICDGLEYYK